MAGGDNVLAADDGLRQIGDSVHAKAGKGRQVDDAVRPRRPVMDGVLTPAGCEFERVGAKAAIEGVVASAAEQRVVVGATIEEDRTRRGMEIRRVGAAVEDDLLHVGAELRAAKRK